MKSNDCRNIFYDKLKDIQLQIRLWRCRGLSLLGKITIIKSFLLSKMTHVFSVLPTLEEFIKQLNTIIYNFLWNGPDKIARLAVGNDIKFLDDNSRKNVLIEFCCGEKVFDPVLCKSKQFYKFLIAKKGIVSRGFTKLKNYFDLDDITVSKVFLNLLSVSLETFS